MTWCGTSAASADPKAPQFYTQQFALSRAYLTNYDSIEKVDDHTVAITTKFVESLFPYDMAYVLMISRCRAEALHNNWDAYASQPSGTGPYSFASMTAHERMELVPNKEYWDKARVPKQDKLILLPMPEAATRTAALLSGQVNFIEAPAPDAIPVLKRAGMQIVTNTYPHNWPYILNFTRGPFTDLRVRQAANYAINRDDVVDLVGGLATPEYAEVPPSPAVLRPPRDLQVRQGQGARPAEGSRLPAVQGHAGDLHLRLRPDAVAADERAGEAATGGRRVPGDAGRDGLERAAGRQPLRRAEIPERRRHERLARPARPGQRHHQAGRHRLLVARRQQLGPFRHAEADGLVKQIFEEFDPAKRLALLTKLHEYESEQALMIFVVHDLNPRALSPKVHGFVQAQNWFQDLTPITVSP